MNVCLSKSCAHSVFFVLLIYAVGSGAATNATIGAVVASGVVPRLVELLGHPSASVIKPALSAAGDIVSDDDITSTQAVLDCPSVLVTLSQLYPILFHLFVNVHVGLFPT